MKKLSLNILFLFFVALTFAQSNLLRPEISGYRLRRMYLNLHVEKRWLAGTHVDWVTGKPDKPKATTENTTHCSAFVAAACQQAGIYILRPPEHIQELLANAQYDWLRSAKGYKAGWRQIKNKCFENAQIQANKGYVVVAAYKNANPSLAGHIVCVMPAKISKDSLYVYGPQVTQAARKNEINTKFRFVFKRVIKQWPKTPVLFFYNEKQAF